ncbi:MAG: M16 family metallopeptidase [Acidobacteriota bacterium]
MRSPRHDRPAALIAAMALALTLAVSGSSTAAQQQIPAHPSELEFPPLDFEPPSPDEYRHELDNGVPVFVVEDHELPLVNVQLLVRTGEYTRPAVDSPGLAGLTGSQIRAGGTASMTASEFDEEVDFLAAQMGSRVGETQGGANMNCLAKDLDRCLELFFEMLREPRFQEDRLELAKSQRLQQMERRNDSTASIEGREWSRLVYGPDHFSTVAATESDIEAITREDLIAFHEFAFHPGNFVLAVSGDVTPGDILPRLTEAMSGWDQGPEPGAVPGPDHELEPGLYLVHKEDVNQGRVSIGHLATTRDDPNRHALQVMNDILGGGGHAANS